jgi:hypothetical protein
LRDESHTVSIENLDADQVGLFGHTMGLSRSYASHMRAVAVKVFASFVGDQIETTGYTTMKINVGRPNTAVYNIDVHIFSSAIVPVGFIQRETALIQPVQAPRRIVVNLHIG